MRNSSSTSNFRPGPAFLGTLALVVVLEMVAANTLPSQQFNHLVDRILFEIRTKPQPAEVLILGDSVGRQISLGLARAEPNRIKTFASNASLETVGQYFLFRRYLESNPPPRDLVLILVNPFSGNLDQVFTQNYVQRCFVEWSEIGDLAVNYRNPEFSAVMLGYKLLPSFRYRNYFQDLLGMSHIGRKPRESVEPAVPQLQPKTRSKGLDQLFTEVFSRHTTSASEIYFRKLLQLATDRGTRVVFIPTPLPEAKAQEYLRSSKYKEMVRKLDQCRSEFTDLVVATPRAYPATYALPDNVHFKKEVLSQVTDDYLGELRTCGCLPPAVPH